ncbi:hypothetical protein BDZ94DRAFT_1037892 [Collybia nuda]|uniref:DUF6535 domain-containing protein n=1 Tax=Collybia nuda TaxID=64659 RepID=A0A9P5YGW2_9AGAR|nr:hypothetical protein BDZ94DRAFT_1037892 [Collybia nuda]
MRMQRENQPTWKPWIPEEPYRTQVPKSNISMEGWLTAMEVADDGMCKGWRDQIDTLIIFAGLFSATVTAFTVESYRWLKETPSDTLARLELRVLLSAAHDAATDSLAPAAFNVDAASILINALWFASLGLALAAVVVSILCKQWLYEYQRYENITTEESFLIHGLRYRGLLAWRVPEIIGSLPLLLQTALVLFLIGLLVLLVPLQPIVGSIVCAIVGVTLLFLGITTILPSIQYIYPKFRTQCAYKSSQSWSFFVISAFWMFDFRMFTNWAMIDHWEVTCVSNGMGFTLSRVYELLSNSIDAFQSIYAFLADTSLKPTIWADLEILSDFIDGLDAPRKDAILSLSGTMETHINLGHGARRVKELKGHAEAHAGRLKPRYRIRTWGAMSRHLAGPLPIEPSHHYQLQTQKTLCQLLKSDDHFSNSTIYNRYVEHWARCMEGWPTQATSNKLANEIFYPIHRATQGHIRWDPVIASYLVGLFSHLLRENFVSMDAMNSLVIHCSGLVKCHYHQPLSSSPFVLLQDIQNWVNRMPDSDLTEKATSAGQVLYRLVYKGDLFVELSHTSEEEKRDLREFAQFFIEFIEGLENLHEPIRLLPHFGERPLVILRSYLDQYPPPS